MQQLAGQDAQEGRNERQWRDKRRWPRQMGGGSVKIGNTTTSRARCTRGTRGDEDMTRGNGATRGAGAGRWDAAA